MVHLGQYAFFTAVLYLVKVYANIAARNLFKGSPLVRQKGIGGIWLVDNEQKLWAGRGMELWLIQIFTTCAYIYSLYWFNKATVTTSVVNNVPGFHLYISSYILHHQHLLDFLFEERIAITLLWKTFEFRRQHKIIELTPKNLFFVHQSVLVIFSECFLIWW